MKLTIRENAKRILSLLLCFVMAFSLCTPAFAQDGTQTGIEQGINEEVSVASADELEEAIASAAAKICITADFELDRTFYITRDVTIYSAEKHTLTRKADFAGDIFVIGEAADGTVCPEKVTLTVGTKNSADSDMLVIDGNKANMTATVTGTVFFVCKNGQADLHPDLTVTNCEKKGNERSLDNTKYVLSNYYDVIGGAVGIIAEAAKDDPATIADGVMNIYGGKYTYNSSSGESTFGGAFFNHGQLNVYDGIFEYNTSASRAGVFYNYRRMNIYKATIANNDAAATGGAIYLPSSSGAKLYIGGDIRTAEPQVVFRNNTAKDAGAVYSSGTLVARNTVFEGNTSIESGGAVYGSGSNNNITVYNSAFTKNEAGESGGAIYVTGKRTSSDVELHVRDTQFTENKAAAGGAIYLNTPSRAYVRDAAFSKNTASDNGGAAYALGATGEFNYVTFTENKAASGGVIYIGKHTETEKDENGENVTVETSSTVTMNNITATENSVTSSGAVAYITGSELRVYNSTVKQNTAKSGSAFYFSTNAQGGIYNTLIEGNACAETNASNAAAIFIYTGGTKVTVHSCIIKDNTSNGNGGGIFISNKGLLDLYNTTATGNRAAKGGFIYMTTTGTTVTADGITVSGNTATAGGPIIFSNSAAAKLCINKNNYTDKDATAPLDDAYWTGALYYPDGKGLKVEEIDTEVPAYEDYTQPEFDIKNHIGDEHTYSESIIIAPTCTQSGSATFTCVCGDTYIGSVDSLGHDEIPHEGKANTCTEGGWDAYVTCSKCDYTTYNALPVLGHDEIPHDAKAPACDAIGWDEYVSCSRCDYTTYAEKPSLGHDFTEKIIDDAHLKEDGESQNIYYYNCSRCDVMSTEDTYIVVDKLYAEVVGITDGLAVEGTDKKNVVITNSEEITLTYSKADPSIFRFEDGWWAGIKVVAPADLSEEELKNAKYRRYGSDGWSEAKSFWSAKDSKEGDAVHYMEAWMLVTPELIANDEDGKLTINYEFDWYGNGFESAVQKIDFVLDTAKINLNMTPFLGQAEAITKGLTAEGIDEITVTNKEEITLEFVKADPSIFRFEDGWWAGFKVIAPSDLTEEQLKTVKFRKNTDGEWSEPGYFWDVKNSAEGDAVHWVGVWTYVTPEAIAEAVDNKLTYSYEFDWYGNGFESAVQKIDFVLDTTKINLNMAPFLGSVVALTNGISVEGKEEITATNSKEITLTYSKADPSIFRFEDGWWAGIKVVAPADLTEEELKDAKYRSYGSDGWSEAKSFWSAKDSKEGDAVHYMEAWMLVTPELIAKDEDGKLTINYEFDWYGNGFESAVQKIDFVLDTAKINLNMTPFLGSVVALTNGISVEGKEEITATNSKEITLTYSKADPSIFRFEDGWWAGIKVVAPADLSEEELKNAKYRRYGSDGWSEAKLFWSSKDSKEGDAVHYMEAWMLVTPELIAKDEDGKLTINYEFDWYGNGFESAVQKIDFVLDTTKINLNMAPFLGSVVALTNGISVEGKEEILATNSEEITLTYSKADPSIFRFEDGWWAGIKVVAPADLSEEELKNAKYRRYGSDGWSEAKSFWSSKDSKEGDAVHYMEAWMLVTPELIANDEDGKLTINYEFDWYGNGFESAVQKIDFVLDTAKINLNMAPFLGSVVALTNGISVEGKEEITATNSEEITLTYSKADPSIFRFEDGWWAGIKVVAPADLTEEELKNAKYRRYGSDGWSEAKSFWSAKDSKEGDAVHYMEAWMLVTPELIANDEDGKLTINYEFDWYGNGFESAVQKIDFVLDTAKIILDHENHYGSVEGITEGLTVSGTTDMVIRNEDEITIDFSLADMSVGRYMDAWWVGAKILAPESLSASELKDARYRVSNGESKAFWDYKDSQDGDEKHYITVWLPVIQDYIDNDVDGILNWTYEFDWDGNGFGISTQKFTVSVDVNKINRIHSAGCTKVIDKAAVAPDCVNTGNTEASHCEVCGLILSVEEEIPALGHTEGEAVIENNVAPDCENEGSYDTVVYCTVCGGEVSRITATVDALGHTEGEAARENDVAPDCENEGSYDTVVYCSVCGDEVSRVTTTVDALGHDYSEKAIDEKHRYQAKTCTTYAKYFYGCIRCDDMTSETYENKAEGFADHVRVRKVNISYLAAAADCENAAKYYMGCLTCDTVFKDETFTDGTPKYHYFGVEKVVTKAGINKNGTTDFFCVDCNKAYGDPISFSGIKSIKLSGTSYSYTGKAIKPSVTVKDSAGKTLKNNIDYTVTYSSNTAPGKATVKVTFKGRYTGSTTLSFTIKQLPATKKIAFTSTTSSITLKWDKVSNADGYKVYIKTTKGYKEIGSTTKNTLKVSKTASGKKLASGTRYTFIVKAYAKPGSKVYVSDASKKIYTATMAAATSKIVAKQTTSSITLQWKKVSGADSYRVYKYNTKTKKYEFYKTVEGTKITIKKLKSGTTYKYLIKAVTLTAGKVKVIGAEKKITVSTKPAAVKLSATAKSTTATLKWKSVTGATGYQIYMKTGSGKTKLIDTVKKSKTSFTKKKLKKGTKYTFSVRAYRTVDGKKIYGDYGKKAITIK